MVVDRDYIGKRLKHHGYNWQKVALLLGIEYQTLYKNIKNHSLETILRISNATGINFVELLLPPKGFTHIYNDKGEWLGIMKNNSYI